MVKVLKYGKQYATCNKCHSVIKFEDEDIGTIQTGINDYDSVVKCPVCENQIKESYWRKNLKLR